MDSEKFDRSMIAKWVSIWNNYDLSMVEKLFLNDSRVSYFSSERKGLIKGIDKLVKHHEGFGFVPGGKTQPNRLWLEDIDIEVFNRTAIVTALWFFQRGGANNIQSGPVTLVYVLDGVEWRIAHANFSNYR
ncbi:hypothetical protein KEJ47_08920 [Candidatus Bathyarchaeota archaeon]|nr:hypothetical protein [Candidatus Bathyarchaeota archaeon]